MSRDEQRRILETAFEPHGDGIPAFGPRRAFYRRIEGRAPAAGRRDAAGARQQMITSLPTITFMGAVLIGIALLALTIAKRPLVDPWLVGGGALLVLLSGYVLLVKAMLKR